MYRDKGLVTRYSLRCDYTRSRCRHSEHSDHGHTADLWDALWASGGTPGADGQALSDGVTEGFWPSGGSGGRSPGWQSQIQWLDHIRDSHEEYGMTCADRTGYR